MPCQRIYPKPVISPPPAPHGYVVIPTMRVFDVIRRMKQEGLDATGEYNTLWHFAAESLGVNETELRQFVYGESKPICGEGV